MEKIIGVKDLQHLDLLRTKYTKLDVYDAFMIYLISRNGDETSQEHIILKSGDYVIDSSHCFNLNNWLV